MNNEEQFSGVMFVKNKFDTCRVEVANSNSATLVLGLPKDFGMRPITLDEMEDESHKKDKENEKKVFFVPFSLTEPGIASLKSILIE